MTASVAKGKRTLNVRLERWEPKAPFRIAGRTFSGADLVVCEIGEQGVMGRGEAAGVFYTGEDATIIEAQIAAYASEITGGIGQHELLERMDPGGARNAIDAALWDLQAQLTRRTVWDLVGLPAQPVTTAFTISLESSPEAMAEKALAALDRSFLKIKLDSDGPIERVTAIRQVRPDAKLVADVNGSWTFEQLKEWAPQMKRLGLDLLEQPLSRGDDESLATYESPVPLFADESCLDLSELPQAADRYEGIVIKLDKTGGLTEALQLARAAKAQGLKTMVGCMLGTSLAMAPAHVLAQLCDLVDIDAPLLFAEDRPKGLIYTRSTVSVPDSSLWGMPR